MKKVMILGLLGMVLWGSSVEAAKIYLRDGDVIGGKILKSEAGKILVETRFGIKEFEEAVIIKIEYEQGEKPTLKEEATIFLTDDSKITGKIVGIETFTIKTKMGLVKIPLNEVKLLSYEEVGGRVSRISSGSVGTPGSFEEKNFAVEVGLASAGLGGGIKLNLDKENFIEIDVGIPIFTYFPVIGAFSHVFHSIPVGEGSLKWYVGVQSGYVFGMYPQIPIVGKIGLEWTLFPEWGVYFAGGAGASINFGWQSVWGKQYSDIVVYPAFTFQAAMRYYLDI